MVDVVIKCNIITINLESLFTLVTRLSLFFETFLIRQPFYGMLLHNENMPQRTFDSVHDHAFCIHFRKLHRYLRTTHKFVSQMGCLSASLSPQMHKYLHIPDLNEYIQPSFLHRIHVNKHQNSDYMLPYTRDML